ncbi:hypothetical protein EV182_002353 [Spiromyces aspiralis]|uniref:Uncharacterized protein n=1 Tax=Spiromyces aspiralis TaxID=68401 RepID=A0ACC1HHQ6_9FUNG|nr:hypothetical protein EV182_002353 [Spiromyces aspiralis]
MNVFRRPKLSIHLDSPRVLLRGSSQDASGTIISGCIVMELPRPAHIKSLTLQFRGLSTMAWKYIVHNIEHEFSNDAVPIESTKTLIAPCDNGNTGTLKAGRYEYPFSIPIPGDLPETITTPYASTAYYFDAVLRTSLWTPRVSCRREVIIARDLTASGYSGPGPIDLSHLWQDMLDMHLVVHEGAFKDGQPITAYFTFQPRVKGIRLQQVVLLMKEYVEYYAPGAPEKTLSRVVDKSIKKYTPDSLMRAVDIAATLDTTPNACARPSISGSSNVSAAESRCNTVELCRELGYPILPTESTLPPEIVDGSGVLLTHELIDKLSIQVPTSRDDIQYDQTTPLINIRHRIKLGVLFSDPLGTPRMIWLNGPVSIMPVVDACEEVLPALPSYEGSRRDLLVAVDGSDGAAVYRPSIGGQSILSSSDGMRSQGSFDIAGFESIDDIPDYHNSEQQADEVVAAESSNNDDDDDALRSPPPRYSAIVTTTATSPSMADLTVPCAMFVHSNMSMASFYDGSTSSNGLSALLQRRRSKRSASQPRQPTSHSPTAMPTSCTSQQQQQSSPPQQQQQRQRQLSSASSSPSSSLRRTSPKVVKFSPPPSTKSTTSIDATLGSSSSRVAVHSRTSNGSLDSTTTTTSSISSSVICSDVDGSGASNLSDAATAGSQSLPTTTHNLHSRIGSGGTSGSRSTPDTIRGYEGIKAHQTSTYPTLNVLRKRQFTIASPSLRPSPLQNQVLHYRAQSSDSVKTLIPDHDATSLGTVVAATNAVSTSLSSSTASHKQNSTAALSRIKTPMTSTPTSQQFVI